MKSNSNIRVDLDAFTSKAEVLDEISRLDLWPATACHEPFEAGLLHYHAEDVRIYVLSGTLLVHGLPPAKIVHARPGTRITLPAGAVHALSSEEPIVTITALENAAACAGLPKMVVDERGERISDRIRGAIA